MKVVRYFSEPIRMKREADPINETTRANKTIPIMLIINSFFRRFLRAVFVSCRYSLRIDFASFSNA
jgi:hypothetical protein